MKLQREYVISRLAPLLLFDTIEKHDLEPFAAMIRSCIPSLMLAHIIYSKVDDKPAGFSKKWLKDILRDYLGFQGVIFSDDLSMAGAEFAGNYYQRAVMALDAGCDMLLVCNHPEAVKEIIDQWDYETDPVTNALSKNACTLQYNVDIFTA